MKEVEFGLKCVVSHVNGYVFLDKLGFETFKEAKFLEESLERYKERFGVEAKGVVADKLYGTRANRKMLQEKSIRSNLVPLGKRSKVRKKEME